MTKHIFLRVDTQLRQQEEFQLIKNSISEEIQKDTHFDYIDCLNFKEMTLKRQILSIFIIPPRILFPLKEKFRYFSRNVKVIVMCKDQFDVRHQTHNLCIEKVVKLITCDINQVIYYIKNKIDHCYLPTLKCNSDPIDCKFSYNKLNQFVINLYYPSKFQQFTKLFQLGASKRRANYPNLHFYCYNNKKDIVLKDKFKIKTKKMLTRDKISTDNALNNIESKLSISMVNDFQTNIIIASRENQDQMIEYIDDRTSYDIITLGSQQQKSRFLKQFEELFSGTVNDIQIISSEKLKIFIPYSDKDLIDFIRQTTGSIYIQIIQYSSLSILSEQVYCVSQSDEQFGLILSQTQNQQMMEMMLTMKDIKNVKLIVCPCTKSHMTKLDSINVYRRVIERQNLFQLLKDLFDWRKQYFFPIETVKHRKIVLLIYKIYTELCQQIIQIVNMNQSVQVKVYQKQEDLYELISKTSSQINYIAICKQQRRVLIQQYTKIYQNVKFITLSQFSDVPYDCSILEIFTKQSDLLQFVAKLCQEKQRTDKIQELQYSFQELLDQQRKNFNLESLVIVPIRQNYSGPSIIIYSPRKQQSQSWLILERRLRALDKRIQIFHYNKVMQIAKINLSQQPLSIVLVSHPYIQWASNYLNQFQSGINIIAYSKKPFPPQSMLQKKLNLTTSKLQEIQLFIVSAIQYYDHHKARIVTEHDINQATKLSLHSQMMLAIQNNNKKISSNFLKCEYFEDPPKPQTQLKMVSNTINNYQENIKSNKKNNQQQIIKNNLHTKIKSRKISQLQRFQQKEEIKGSSKISLYSLCMESDVNDVQLKVQENDTFLKNKKKVYILQHKSIGQQLFSSQSTKTIVYDTFQELVKIYNQLLSQSQSKIIVKLVGEVGQNYFDEHHNTTVIRYNSSISDKQNRREKSLSRAPSILQFNYRQKLLERQSKLRQSSSNSTRNNRLRKSSLNKFKKQSQLKSLQENYISATQQNFFSSLYQKQLIQFFINKQDKELIKIVNMEKKHNPRIRIQKIDNMLDFSMDQQKQEKCFVIFVSRDSQTIRSFLNGSELQCLKIVYVGCCKSSPSMLTYPNYLHIQNTQILAKLIGYIPRFYQIEKLTREQLCSSQIIHFYLQQQLPAEFLKSLIGVLIKVKKCIPHKLSSHQLRYISKYENELIIVVVSNSIKLNQIYPFIKAQSKIKVYNLEEQEQQLCRVLQTLNCGDIVKLGVSSSQIKQKIFQLQYNRTLHSVSDTILTQDSNQKQNQQTSFTILRQDPRPLVQTEIQNKKEKYHQLLQQIDQTAYIFLNKIIFEKIEVNSKKSTINVVLPKNQQQLTFILSHLPELNFKTYQNYKTFQQLLIQFPGGIFFLNKQTFKYIKQLITENPSSLYFGYQKQDKYGLSVSCGYRKVQNILSFAIFLQIFVRFLQRRSKFKSKQLTSRITINIFYKYPTEYSLKQSLQKISQKIKCVAYDTVTGLIQQLKCFDVKDSLNIVVCRDWDILELQSCLDFNCFKIIRMLSSQFLQQKQLSENENVLIQATKYSSVVKYIENIASQPTQIYKQKNAIALHLTKKC